MPRLQSDRAPAPRRFRLSTREQAQADRAAARRSERDRPAARKRSVAGGRRPEARPYRRPPRADAPTAGRRPPAPPAWRALPTATTSPRRRKPARPPATHCRQRRPWPRRGPAPTASLALRASQGFCSPSARRSAGVDSPVVRSPRARRAPPVLHAARRRQGVRRQLRPARRDAAESGDRARRRRPPPALAARLTPGRARRPDRDSAVAIAPVRRPVAPPDPLECAREIGLFIARIRVRGCFLDDAMTRREADHRRNAVAAGGRRDRDDRERRARGAAG